MLRLLLLMAACSAAVGCAYPRRTTPLSPAPAAMASAAAAGAPSDLWGLRVLSAELPQRKPSGLAWDSDGSGPDPFVRLVIDGKVIWESDVVENQTHPEWNATLPKNIVVPSDKRFRLEVWDHDTDLDADPMGAISRTGLPSNAMPDAEARLTLDNLAIVTVMVTAPRAHKGVGLRVEVRPDELVVLEVEPYSPASRAGLEPGHRIVAIGEEAVAQLSDSEAISKLSLIGQHGGKVLVKTNDKGGTAQVNLDDDPTWLVMEPEE